MDSFRVGWQAGTTAFQSAYQQSNPFSGNLDYQSYNARRSRYDVNWQYFKNNAYSSVHAWASTYRQTYALYKYVRNIYNPARRLALFWQGALAGGALDPEAGDGKRIKSALPILTDNDALRLVLAKLWRDSNMAAKKDENTLLGTIFGDTGWRIRDDTLRGKVMLEPLQANELYDVVLDSAGNVKAYTIVEVRMDPDSKDPRLVDYAETATRDGDNVIYETFKDRKPFAWNGETSKWEVPYGFVPLVVTKHTGVGAWGESEYGDDLPKIREIDDLASMLHDYVRKAVNAPMMVTGMNAPEDGSTPTTKATRTANQRAHELFTQQGRQEIPLFYGLIGGEAHPVLAPLDIAAAGERVDKLLLEFQRDHAELRIDELRVSGGLTGRALELAREPAEVKGARLRTNYDAGFVHAHQMAIAIGGFRGYPGYEGYSLDSFRLGVLDHSIGERAIFESSPTDQLEAKEKFWQIVVAASPSVGERVVLRDLGWSDEKILEELGNEVPTEPPVPAENETNPALDEVKQAMEEFRAAMGAGTES